MAVPVTLVEANGIPVTESADGTPLTPADNAMPVVVVADGGLPVVLVNDDGSAYEAPE